MKAKRKEHPSEAQDPTAATPLKNFTVSNSTNCRTRNASNTTEPRRQRIADDDVTQQETGRRLLRVTEQHRSRQNVPLVGSWGDERCSKRQVQTLLSQRRTPDVITTAATATDFDANPKSLSFSQRWYHWGRQLEGGRATAVTGTAWAWDRGSKMRIETQKGHPTDVVDLFCLFYVFLVVG